MRTGRAGGLGCAGLRRGRITSGRVSGRCSSRRSGDGSGGGEAAAAAAGGGAEAGTGAAAGGGQQQQEQQQPPPPVNADRTGGDYPDGRPSKPRSVPPQSAAGDG